MNPEGSQGAVIKTAVTLAGENANLAPPPFGHVTAQGLLSLKYYITSMGICQTADINGTGFGMGPNCITLYEAPAYDPFEFDRSVGTGIPSFEQYVEFANAARADDANPYYIDLMDAASRATMARTVTLTTEHVGSYQYGYVYWYYPLKLKAEVALADGTVLYTHDGTTAVLDHGNGYTHVYTKAGTPFTQSPAEEAIFIQQYGGNWFKFQSPFDISEADITNATEFRLDLAFNPEGVVKGIGSAWGSNNNVLVDGDISEPCNQLDVPLLDLAPVVHRVDEKAIRESYVFDVSAPTSGNQFQIRYDLYYAEPRPDAILAVETKTLVTERTTELLSHAWSVSFIETDADGVLTFKRWDKAPILTRFARGAAAGDTVTATLHCEGNSGTFNWCDSNNENPLTGKLVSISGVGGE